MENQYARVVPWDGNPKALQVIDEVMELRPHFEWRGLGFIAHSALRVRERYAAFDAERIFACPACGSPTRKACQCGEVLKGVLKPWECKVFGTACTPETPIGTCMVSTEGACAAYYNFGRFSRERVKEATPGVTDRLTAPAGTAAPGREGGRRPGVPARHGTPVRRAARSRCWTGSTGRARASRGSGRSGSRSRTAPAARPRTR